MNHSIVVMFRWGGLGDVLMALAASRAVKIMRQAKVVLVTQPAYHELARLCPSIDAVFSSAAEIKRLIQAPPEPSWPPAQAWKNAQMYDLGPAAFGLDPVHQVDAYLRIMGLEAPPDLKHLLLVLSPEAEAEAEAALTTRGWEASVRPVLVHAAKGDPNRTWPKENWRRLIQELQSLGHSVALIGNTQADADRGVHDLAISGTLDLVNGLSLPGLVALMRRSALLVTTDSGPVQLAGATTIPIVGLYTVAPGRSRLPYRQGAAAWNAVAVEPACPHAPCYAAIMDRSAQAAFRAKTRVDPSDLPALFSKWCQAAEPYRCLEQEITVERVMGAITNLQPSQLSIETN